MGQELRQFRKDDVLEVTIDDIGSGGEGIGRVDGYTLFVKDAVIGDCVTCRIMKAKKSYAFAKLLSIEKPSPYRVTPPCGIAAKCGGCQIQALSYDKQLEFKQKKVTDDLIRIGGFAPETVARVMHPIVGMENPYRYRNKAQLPVGERDGEPVAGFYAGRTHVIVPVSDCLIGAQQNQQILSVILDYMKRCGVHAYDEKTGTGLLRHILIRQGAYSEEAMVCLVVNGTKLPEEDRLVGTLSALPHMTSITLNTNTARTNVIMGQRMRTLWGADSIRDSLHIFRVVEHSGTDGTAGALSFEPMDTGISFRISPLSFYQVNPFQTEKLYSIALAYAAPDRSKTIWDLYCGVGTISLFLAGFARKVYGVEVVPQAIEDAKKNAELNGITNVAFQAGRAEEVLPAYVRSHHEAGNDVHVDVVVVDPPRKGCDTACLETILQVRPERIVYVSCDPATLARDLKILASGGYELRAVTPVDQFGHTVHVETVCLLSSKSKYGTQ